MPAKAAKPAEPTGLPAEIKKLVDQEKRPCRLDELVSATGGNPEEVKQAVAALAAITGYPVSDYLLDDNFDAPEPSALEASLAEATGPIRVNSGDSEATEGTATKRSDKGTHQALPGMPESLAWGQHDGLRVTHGEAKLSGSFRMPDKLAELRRGGEFVVTVRFKFQHDQFRDNAQQEGKSASLHKNVSVKVVAVDFVAGPLPPS